MKKDHVLNVLFTEHPEWRRLPRKEFTIREQDGWDYVLFRGVKIERVIVVGNRIFEEFLGPSHDPATYPEEERNNDES